MNHVPLTAPLFAVISIVFLLLFARDRWAGSPRAVARKAWLRAGLIFGAVAIVLFVMFTLVGR